MIQKHDMYPLSEGQTIILNYNSNKYYFAVPNFNYFLVFAYINAHFYLYFALVEWYITRLDFPFSLSL